MVLKFECWLNLAFSGYGVQISQIGGQQLSLIQKLLVSLVWTRKKMLGKDYKKLGKKIIPYRIKYFSLTKWEENDEKISPLFLSGHDIWNSFLPLSLNFLPI